MGALLPTKHQEEFHRQSSAATTLKKKSTLPKQGRDDLEVFSKQTSFLVLMLKNVRNHPALFLGAVLTQLVAWTAGRIDVSDVLYHLATDALLITGMSRPGCSAHHWHVKAQRARLWQQRSSVPNAPLPLQTGNAPLPSRQGCLVVGNVVGGGSLHQPTTSACKGWEAAPYTQPGSSWQPSAC